MTLTVAELERVFKSLQKVREPGRVSQQSFDKLASNAVFKRFGIQKTEFTLVFQSASSNQKSVDFRDFMTVMHRLFEQKVNQGSFLDFVKEIYV